MCHIITNNRIHMCPIWWVNEGHSEGLRGWLQPPIAKRDGRTILSPWKWFGHLQIDPFEWPNHSYTGQKKNCIASMQYDVNPKSMYWRVNFIYGSKTLLHNKISCGKVECKTLIMLSLKKEKNRKTRPFLGFGESLIMGERPKWNVGKIRED